MHVFRGDQNYVGTVFCSRLKNQRKVSLAVEGNFTSGGHPIRNASTWRMINRIYRRISAFPGNEYYERTLASQSEPLPFLRTYICIYVHAYTHTRIHLCMWRVNKTHIAILRISLWQQCMYYSLSPVRSRINIIMNSPLTIAIHVINSSLVSIHPIMSILKNLFNFFFSYFPFVYVYNVYMCVYFCSFLDVWLFFTLQWPIFLMYIFHSKLIFAISKTTNLNEIQYLIVLHIK